MQTSQQMVFMFLKDVTNNYPLPQQQSQLCTLVEARDLKCAYDQLCTSVLLFFACRCSGFCL